VAGYLKAVGELRKSANIGNFQNNTPELGDGDEDNADSKDRKPAWKNKNGGKYKDEA
jgi:hypothetical protein